MQQQTRATEVAKESMPSPAPPGAFDEPGTSAITKLLFASPAPPQVRVQVVNGSRRPSRAFDTAAISVDLPAFGKPAGRHLPALHSSQQAVFAGCPVFSAAAPDWCST